MAEFSNGTIKEFKKEFLINERTYVCQLLFSYHRKAGQERLLPL